MASVSGSLHEQLRQWLELYLNQYAVQGQTDFIHYCLQQLLCGFQLETGPPIKVAGLCHVKHDGVVTLEGDPTCLWRPSIWSSGTEGHAGATPAHL